MMTCSFVFRLCKITAYYPFLQEVLITYSAIKTYCTKTIGGLRWQNTITYNPIDTFIALNQDSLIEISWSFCSRDKYGLLSMSRFILAIQKSIVSFACCLVTKPPPNKLYRNCAVPCECAAISKLCSNAFSLSVMFLMGRFLIFSPQSYNFFSIFL